MTVCTKGLILVHRAENSQDFAEIGRRMRKLDPSIAVLMVPDFMNPKMLPPSFTDLPILIIYLVNPPAYEFKVMKKLAVRSLNKIEEYEHLKAHSIPCLPILIFQKGMQLDRNIFGDLVVMKPGNLTSTGKDINVVPTKLISELKQSDFPEGHLIHNDIYLIQRFVRTGSNPIHYRVSTFLGRVLYSTRSELNFPYPDYNLPLSELLTRTVASNYREHRTIKLHKNEEVIKLALLVADSLSDVPLLGIDIIQDAETGEYFVIETNPGGNTWHFTSVAGRGMVSDLGGRNQLIRQNMAWDVAAEALVSKTLELAS